MRNFLIAIAALGVSVSVAGPASATPVRVLHAHRVTADGMWAGQADATTAAYRTPGSTAVVLRSDDGISRTVAAPDGCAIKAAGAGLLASTCAVPGEMPYDAVRVPLRLAVSRLDGSLVTRFLAVGQADLTNSFGPGSPVAIGTQWIRQPNTAKQGGSWWEDINWHTAEVRESEETDASTIEDLGTPALSVPLCAPLARVWRGAPDMDALPGYYAADVRGSWALMEGVTGSTLWHCGLARPVRLPERFAPVALGEGWVAGYTTVAHRSPRVDVIRLSDRRRFAVAGVPGALTRAEGNGELAFTRGRLYAFDGVAIHTIMLPRR